MNDLEQYYLEQAHRKASEQYIASYATGKTKEQRLKHLSCAEEYGQAAFAMAQSTLARAAEYNFLLAVYGLRVLVETGYESEVTHAPDVEQATLEELKEDRNGIPGQSHQHTGT